MNTPRELLRRHSPVSLATLAVVVAILAIIGVPKLAHINDSATQPAPTPSPTVHVLRLSVDGNITYAQADYTDATGDQYEVDLDADIQVTGLRHVIIVAVGEDPGCSILLDGETVAANGANNPGGMIMAVCEWPTT